MAVKMDQRKDSGILARSSPNCYLCGAGGNLLYRDMADRHFGAPGKWNLVRCSNPRCGLLWLNPKPLEDEIGKAYRNYFTHGSHSEGLQRNGINRIIWKTAWTAYRVLLRLTGIGPERKRRERMYLDQMPPGRLLDVGCGKGEFLALMQKERWDVEGQEVDLVAAESVLKNHRIKVNVGQLEDIGYPDCYFDAVVMSHVIEHINEPIAILKECRRILKPGVVL